MHQNHSTQILNAPNLGANGPTINTQPKARKRVPTWPDKSKWEREIATRLKNDEKARSAFQRLLHDGCLWGNLMSFLQGYTFGHSTVFKEHSARRNRLIQALKGLSGRLDRTASATEEAFDIEYRRDTTLAAFLQEGSLDILAVSPDGQAISGKLSTDFVLQLPEILRKYSMTVNHLQKELAVSLGPRKAGKSIYLAEFVVYIEALTKQDVRWEELAELVNVARPETWEEQQVDGALLKRNFKNFQSRNEELLQDIRTDIAAYVDFCTPLSPKERPTLIRWTLARRAENSPPS